MKSVFRDKTIIYLKAGNGGDGAVTFDKMRKPSGGFGGDGGDVYIEGDSNMSHFKELRYGENYQADNGQNGAKNNLFGRKGEDLLIKVPLVTSVYNELGELVTEIKEHGQRELLLKGGKGGVGNQHYRRGGFATREKFGEGKEGEEMEANLVLELQSDIILIGYPNAGKSSLISEISNAKSKVGEYAFTTIFPVLGEMDGLRLLDLPGLIEDTHKGKGLGTGFLKHTRRARMIAHFVSFDNPDMLETYKTLRAELGKIDASLIKKPEVILLTKSDLVNPDEREKMKKKFEQEFEHPVYIVSTYDLDALTDLKSWLTANYKKLTR